MTEFLYQHRWIFLLLLFCFGFLIPSSGGAFVFGIAWTIMALLVLGSDLE